MPDQQIAIHYAPDAYATDHPAIVGRQAASQGFLRALVGDKGAARVTGYGPQPQAPASFARMVQALNPDAETLWIPAEQLERLAAIGLCYRPDPRLSGEARLRQRIGPASYSLCGVTHTTVGAFGELAAMLTEPVMPWDAVVCTSHSVRTSIVAAQEVEADYLRWRLGSLVSIAGPELPVIPLGVHCEDFDFSETQRNEARARLGLEADEVLALFVGRLTYTQKAHPLPMYLGLQAAAQQTGQRIVLAQCGYFAHPTIEKAYRSGAELFCPDVRCIFPDGRIVEERQACWAAADLFVSLSDNIQETFGLTPIEAMASGLPVVVTDWDGYRETVRGGVDGFCVPTWAPEPGLGEHFARAYQAGGLSTELFCWAAAAATSVELAKLVEALVTLISNPALRRKMGDAGRARARERFAWKGILSEYQALWQALRDRRLAAEVRDAPRAVASHLDPFRAFGHYPSASISLSTCARLAPNASWERYTALSNHALFPLAPAPERLVGPLWPLLGGNGLSIADAGGALGCSSRTALLVIAALAKMGLVLLEGEAR